MEESHVVFTDILIALCHILDDFEEFNKRLIKVMSSECIHPRDFRFQLQNISEGKPCLCLGASKVAKFYNENKTVIDILNKYTSVSYFIYSSGYSFENGKLNTSNDLKIFYEYISSHKEDIDKIIKLLERIKKLGFDTFIFNEDIDFTQKEYSVNPFFKANYTITYLDNIEVLPDYARDISYRTTSSNYKIELSIVGEGISRYNKPLVLNSLLFDSDRLPESINRENTFEKILKLKSEQQEQTNLLRNSVNLGVGVLDLKSQFVSTAQIIDRLNDVQNKEELIQVLSRIKEEIEKLENLSAQYDSSISEKEPLLTPEVLERGKRLYLARRDS